MMWRSNTEQMRTLQAVVDSLRARVFELEHRVRQLELEGAQRINVPYARKGGEASLSLHTVVNELTRKAELKWRHEGWEG